MNRMSKGFTLLELMVVIALISILSSIAVPTFLEMEGRAKQAEAKTNLRALYNAEKAYFAENNSFTTLVRQVGFNIERSNRYQYNLASTTITDDRSTTSVIVTNTTNAISIDTFRGFSFGTGASAATLVTAGVCGGNIAWGLANLASGEAVFTGGAQANIDSDATLDLWTISTASRALTACNNFPPTINSPAGEPANESNDLIF
jgi:type IV pilus assembly protein PilA